MIGSFRRLAQRIKDAIRQHPQTDSKGHPADSNSQEAQDIRRAIVDISDSIRREIKTYQTESSSDHRKARLVTWAAVIGAWIYAIVAIFQWCEFRETNRLTQAAQKETRDLIEAENRAWLDVQRIGENSWSDERRFRTKVFLHNAGRVPALRAEAIIGLRVMDTLPTSTSELEGGFKPYPLGTVLPGIDQFVPMTSPTTIDRPTEHLVWITKTRYLVVSGFLRYADRYSRQRDRVRSTPVCWYYDNDVGGFVRCGLSISPE